MLKNIVTFFLFFMLAVSSVFADGHMDDLSVFHKQGYTKDREPIGQDAFYARKAPMPTVYDGYFGFSFGGGFADLKPKLAVYDLSGTSSFLDGRFDNEKRTALHLLPGIYGGFGMNYRNFYIAGEASAFYNTLNKSVKQSFSRTTTSSVHNTEMKFQMPAMASLDILPGFINEARSFILYARFGLGAGWLKLNLKDSVENLSESANKIKLGYRMGAGLEYLFGEKFGMRLEYVYSRFEMDDVVKFTRSRNYKYECGSGKMNIHTLNFGFSIR